MPPSSIAPFMNDVMDRAGQRARTHSGANSASLPPSPPSSNSALPHLLSARASGTWDPVAQDAPDGHPGVGAWMRWLMAR